MHPSQDVQRMKYPGSEKRHAPGAKAHSFGNQERPKAEALGYLEAKASILSGGSMLQRPRRGCFFPAVIEW
jgi:hypothetical protein